MRKSEFTLPHIQKAIDAKERLIKANALACGEKTATEQYDAFYRGKSTDNTSNHDKQEINSYMELE